MPKSKPDFTMARSELLDKLNVVKPALSSNDTLPVLTHIWFTGDRLLAYNDMLALSVPCKTRFTGAIHGSTLFALLSKSSAKTVEFTVIDDTTIAVKASRSNVKLGMLSEDDFIFEMPTPTIEVRLDTEKPRKAEEEAKTKFLEAVDLCLKSVSSDVSIPDKLGVTFVPSARRIDLYSTNDATLSHTYVSSLSAVSMDSRAVLPTAFCRQLIKLAAAADDWVLEVSEFGGYCLLCTSNDEMLFSRIVETEHELDFADIINHHVPEALSKRTVPIPSAIKLMLERSLVVSGDEPSVLKISDNSLRIDTKSARGSLIDRAKLAKDHWDISIHIDPQLLKVGINTYTHMLVTEDCVIMTKDGSLYLIAASS